MQGFNMGRYIPPDALDRGLSLNQASGKGHALGKRARPATNSLVVRFELPFAVWCTTCIPEAIIGQGVRFNAEKKKVGNYYSTPVWAFRFKHTACGGTIEVRTDPKAAEYVVVEGGRRRDYGVVKEKEWGVVGRGDRASEEEKERLEKEGGFAVLEKVAREKGEKESAQRRVRELWEDSAKRWADPYEVSKVLRREFRVGRRQRQDDKMTGGALADKYALNVEVLATDERDAEAAGEVEFGRQKDQRGSSAKSIFPAQDQMRKSTVEAGHGRTSRSGKAGKSDTKADQKNELKNVLKGNTLASHSPFSDDRDRGAWEPRAKRRKQLNDPVDISTSEPRHGAISVPGTSECTPTSETLPKPGQVQPNMATNGLVAYDSD